MERDQMEKAVLTLIEKTLNLQAELALLAGRVQTLEDTLKGAVPVSPETAKELLDAATDGEKKTSKKRSTKTEESA